MKRILTILLLFISYFANSQTIKKEYNPVYFQEWVKIKKYLNVADTISCDSLYICSTDTCLWISPYTINNIKPDSTLYATIWKVRQIIHDSAYSPGVHIRIGADKSINLGDAATSNATTINIDGSVADNDMFSIGPTNPFMLISGTSNSINLTQKTGALSYAEAILDVSGSKFIGYSPTRSKAFEIHADSSQCAILRSAAPSDSVPLKFINNATTSAVIWAKGNELYFKNNSGTSKTLTELATDAVIDTTKTPLPGHYGTQYDLSLKVDKSTTINSKALTGNIVLNKADFALTDTVDDDDNYGLLSSYYYNKLKNANFISGTLTPGQVIYALSSTSVGGSSGLTFNSTTGTMTIGAGTVQNLLIGSPGTTATKGFFMDNTSTFGFSSVATPGSVSNFINNFNSNTGLVIKRVSTGTGGFLECWDYVTNPKLVVTKDGYLGIGMSAANTHFAIEVDGSQQIVGEGSFLLGGTSATPGDYVFVTKNTSNIIENYPRADLNTTWTLKNAGKTTTLLNADFTNKTITIGDTLKAPVFKSSVTQFKMVSNYNKMSMKLDSTKFAFYYNSDSLFRIKKDTVYSHKVFKPISVKSTGAVNASYFQMIYGGMSTTLQTTASGLGITNNVGTAFPITMSSGGYGNIALKSGLTTTDVFTINRDFDANTNTVTGYLLPFVDNPTNVTGTIGGGILKAQVGTMTKIIDLNPRATYNLYTFGSYRNLDDTTTLFRLRDSVTTVLKVDAKGYIHNNTPHAAQTFLDSSLIISLTQDVWVQVTNTGKDLFPASDLEDFTDSGDTLICSKDGDFYINWEVNLLGVDSKDYEYRIMRKRGATSTDIWHYKISSSGKASLRPFKKYLYDVVANDRYWIELRSTSSAPGNVTIYNGELICFPIHLN